MNRTDDIPKSIEYGEFGFCTIRCVKCKTLVKERGDKYETRTTIVALWKNDEPYCLKCFTKYVEDPFRPFDFKSKSNGTSKDSIIRRTCFTCGHDIVIERQELWDTAVCTRHKPFNLHTSTYSPITSIANTLSFGTSSQLSTTGRCMFCLNPSLDGEICPKCNPIAISKT